MSKNKGLCKCPPKTKKVCKQSKLVDCISVIEIIEALTMEAKLAECDKRKKYNPPKYRTKAFKPFRARDCECKPPKKSRPKQHNCVVNMPKQKKPGTDDAVLRVESPVTSPKSSSDNVKSKKKKTAFSSSDNSSSPPSTVSSKSNKEEKRPCRLGKRCRSKSCNRRKCRIMAAKKRNQQRRSFRGKGRKPRIQLFPNTEEDQISEQDEIEKIEHVRAPAHLKKGMLKTHSLTILPCTKNKNPDIHYGILMGSYNMYDAKFGARSKGRQALAMSVMAYCLAFHYHPKQWSSKLIDNLVDAGDVWYLQCLDKVHDHSAYQGMCEVLPFGKRQTLILNGKRMQVLLDDPEIVGYTMSKDPTVYNLCRGLNAFFKDNRAGVLLTRVLKVIIWKDKVCYYIFDPAGRDSKATSNYTKGFAALINVKDLPAVADILLARTVLEDQKYLLAPVKVLKIVDENAEGDFEEEKELTPAEKTAMGYRIQNPNYAIVNANMHLGDRCFEDAKFRQALTIAVAAMCYAKISPPNTWFSKTLDKILRLGNKLFNECTNPKVLVDLTIDNIPNEIIIGPYTCEIIIYREKVKGQLFSTNECKLNIHTGLQDFFAREYSSGILQFHSYTLAIWKQKEMYYLFDPYPRATDGSRTLSSGKACCWMFLTPEAMADAFTKNWNYLPYSTTFYIHAFKVLRLQKKAPKTLIECKLSDDKIGRSGKRKVLPPSKRRGRGEVQDTFPVEDMDAEGGPFITRKNVDEEKMGDIVSLIDSIDEEFLPPMPINYKKMMADEMADDVFEQKTVNLDSPTVSVTQVVPAWPRPRDKALEPVEPDPSPEPTPPPTPPPPAPPPEGAEEEEAPDEEEEDEETIKARKEEEARKKAEEEEARRKAEELPPPFPPPPPTPQSELEVPLAPLEGTEEQQVDMEPVQVQRKLLPSQDAKSRSSHAKTEKEDSKTKLKPDKTSKNDIKAYWATAKYPMTFYSFDNSEVLRGTTAITDGHVENILSFSAIMAIVTSYKYDIETWTSEIVTFVTETAKVLYQNKLDKYQLFPIHMIPEIIIGRQAYKARIDVYDEGPTWKLKPVLGEFLKDNDRGMITTMKYSCAFFYKNGMFYLYDGGSCNKAGGRDIRKKGKSCFLRFRTLYDLVARVPYNEDGRMEDQQFVLSKIIVKSEAAEPEDDYTNKKSKIPQATEDDERNNVDSSVTLAVSKLLVKSIIVESRYQTQEDYDSTKETNTQKKTDPDAGSKPDGSSVSIGQADRPARIGYQNHNGCYTIQGTTSLMQQKGPNAIQPRLFVCLIAMLMAAMHPIRKWNSNKIDTCLKKGLEIYQKSQGTGSCEKFIIKNIVLERKIINVNLKKIPVINENKQKSIDQYIKAVMSRLRYVIVSFQDRCMVICKTDAFYHLFDPYTVHLSKSMSSLDNESDSSSSSNECIASIHNASWTLNRSVEALIQSIKNRVSTTSDPTFFTFELTSVKTVPQRKALK